MAKERECPACPYTGLEERQTGKGFVVDECPNCGGRWHDVGELDAVIEKTSKLDAVMSKEGLIKPRPSERQCPACRKKLTNVGLVSMHLRVDACPDCRGFWLDKNELPLLDKLL